MTRGEKDTFVLRTPKTLDDDFKGNSKRQLLDSPANRIALAAGLSALVAVLVILPTQRETLNSVLPQSASKQASFLSAAAPENAGADMQVERAGDSSSDSIEDLIKRAEEILAGDTEGLDQSALQVLEQTLAAAKALPADASPAQISVTINSLRAALNSVEHSILSNESTQLLKLADEVLAAPERFAQHGHLLGEIRTARKDLAAALDGNNLGSLTQAAEALKSLLAQLPEDTIGDDLDTDETSSSESEVILAGGSGSGAAGGNLAAAASPAGSAAATHGGTTPSGSSGSTTPAPSSPAPAPSSPSPAPAPSTPNPESAPEHSLPSLSSGEVLAQLNSLRSSADRFVAAPAGAGCSVYGALSNTTSSNPNFLIENPATRNIIMSSTGQGKYAASVSVTSTGDSYIFNTTLYHNCD